jgi:hypothetical protein
MISLYSVQLLVVGAFVLNHPVMLFNERYGFPSTAGAVDGTHIPIQNPGGANGEVFRNRKSSLNVQVCINLQS